MQHSEHALLSDLTQTPPCKCHHHEDYTHPLSTFTPGVRLGRAAETDERSVVIYTATTFRAKDKQDLWSANLIKSMTSSGCSLCRRPAHFHEFWRNNNGLHSMYGSWRRTKRRGMLEKAGGVDSTSNGPEQDKWRNWTQGKRWRRPKWRGSSAVKLQRS